MINQKRRSRYCIPHRADAVAPHTEGGVVDPVPGLQLPEPGVTAGDPVVGPAPVPVLVHLAAGLAVHRPPVTRHQAVVLTRQLISTTTQGSRPSSFQ